MIRDILEKCNIKTGLIGTIETIIGDTHIPSANTTPESYKVQEYVILTNGKEYILLNFELEIDLKKYVDSWNPNVVFWFDIFSGKSKNRTDLRYFDYLTCEKMFDQGVTGFFKDIKQYKIWKMEDGFVRNVMIG